MRLLYSAAITALLPWARLHLFLRARRQPEYRQHIDERFGYYPPRPDAAPVIWIHAVSVGETRAAEPLIVALRQGYPGQRIVLTHMTPTGRATTSATLADCERCYLPYDTPWGVARFLRHYRPQIGLIMETELWPNLIHACKKNAIPLLLVNARLSEKSARGYARLAGLSRRALGELHAIAAQSEADAARLQVLGASKVAVMGNLKFDTQDNAALTALGQTWRSLIQRPIVLAASTREGEEALLLAAWRTMVTNDTLLVIVPRHPQRFTTVTELAKQCGLVTAQRSQTLPDPETQVWIGDSMGEMAAYFTLADTAIMGGSLLDFGSQNLIEACAAGVPVILGPSVYNFVEAAELAQAAGAALRVRTAADAVTAALGLLQHPLQREAMHSAGKHFAQTHRGATARLMQLITQALPPPQPPSPAQKPI